MRSSLSSWIGKAFLLMIVTDSFVTFQLLAQNQQVGGLNSLGVIKILSIREMTDEEHSKNGIDYLGARYVVRLRFETTANHGVFVYAPYCAQPSGYHIERKDGKIRWFASIGTTDPSKSPGFAAHESLLGSCWLLFRPGSAYEWETLQRPVIGREQAMSIFIKRETNGEPMELISPWYNTSTAESTEGH